MYVVSTVMDVSVQTLTSVLNVLLELLLMMLLVHVFVKRIGEV